MYRTRRSFKLWLISGCAGLRHTFFVFFFRIGVVFCFTSCPRRLDPAFFARIPIIYPFPRILAVLCYSFVYSLVFWLTALVLSSFGFFGSTFRTTIGMGGEKNSTTSWVVGGIKLQDSCHYHHYDTSDHHPPRRRWWFVLSNGKCYSCVYDGQFWKVCISKCCLLFSCVTISAAATVFSFVAVYGLFTVKSCTAAAINPAG